MGVTINVNAIQQVRMNKCIKKCIGGTEDAFQPVPQTTMYSAFSTKKIQQIFSSKVDKMFHLYGKSISLVTVAP